MGDAPQRFCLYLDRGACAKRMDGAVRLRSDCAVIARGWQHNAQFTSKHQHRWASQAEMLRKLPPVLEFRKPMPCCKRATLVAPLVPVQAGTQSAQDFPLAANGSKQNPLFTQVGFAFTRLTSALIPD